MILLNISSLLNEYVNIIEVLLLSLMIGLVLLDLLLHQNDTPDDTLRVIIKNWAYGKQYYLTFGWGALAGHWFFGSTAPIIRSTLWSVVVIVLLTISIRIYAGRLDSKITPLGQLYLLSAGVIAGHFLWSMKF